MNALVFGSDLITVGSLKHLVKCSAISHMEVVTPKSKKQSAPIKFCNGHNIAYHCLPSNIDFKLTNWYIPTNKQWDIGILVSFGYLIPSRIISLFNKGMINVHPSLLPQYVGSAPIPYALLNGDKMTGVSIINVSEKLDSGNILSQRVQIIDQKDTYSSLSHKLADLGGQSLCDTLVNLEKYRENSINQRDNEENVRLLYQHADTIDDELIQMDHLLNMQQQSDDNDDDYKLQLIKTKKINKNMMFIDWSLSAKQIYNRHRAINGLLKNSRTLLGTKNENKLLILIDEMELYENDNDNESVFDENDQIGKIMYCKERDVLFVKCGNDQDKLLGIKQLRVAPSMSSQHLPTFDQLVSEFGNFVTHCNSEEYTTKYMKHLKNHF